MSSVLTSENYYSPEMSMAYMGSTQYKAFCQCEARALALCKGEIEEQPSKAMLMGSYVDAYYSGEMDQFVQDHPEIFKKDGSLKSEFALCETVISRMQRDELYSLLMSGKKQVIRTGTIAGVPFKIKIDSLIDAEICEKIAAKFPDAAQALGMLDGAVVDQKVMAGLDHIWSDEEHAKVPFVEAYGYDIQGAIYQAIEGHMLPFILAVGTKDDSPALAALHIPDEVLEDKLHEIEDRAPRFQQIKLGLIEPTSCGHCAYCRARNKLTRIVDYREV